MGLYDCVRGELYRNIVTVTIRNETTFDLQLDETVVCTKFSKCSQVHTGFAAIVGKFPSNHCPPTQISAGLDASFSMSSRFLSPATPCGLVVYRNRNDLMEPSSDSVVFEIRIEAYGLIQLSSSVDVTSTLSGSGGANFEVSGNSGWNTTLVLRPKRAMLKANVRDKRLGLHADFQEMAGDVEAVLSPVLLQVDSILQKRL